MLLATCVATSKSMQLPPIDRASRHAVSGRKRTTETREPNQGPRFTKNCQFLVHQSSPLSRKGEKTFHFLSKHGSRLALPLQQFAAPVIGHYAVAGCPTSTPNRLALWAFPKRTKCPLHLESAMEMSRVTTLLKPSNFQSISSTTSNYWHWKNPACQDYVFEKKHLPSCLFTGETLKLWNIQHMVLKSLAHLPTVC